MECLHAWDVYANIRSHGHAWDENPPPPRDSFDREHTHARTHARTCTHTRARARSRPDVVSRLAQKAHLPGFKRWRERGRRRGCGKREEGTGVKRVHATQRLLLYKHFPSVHSFIAVYCFCIESYRHILLYKRIPSKNSVILFIFILIFVSFNIFYYIRYIFYYIHYI
jgi:hypothetical protein